MRINRILLGLIAAVAAVLLGTTLAGADRRDRAFYNYYGPASAPSAITTLMNATDLRLRADLSVYEDTGSTDAAEDGEVVLRWNDADNNISFANTNSPTWDDSVAGINGQAAVIIPSGARMQTTTNVLNYLGSQPWTMFAVIEHDNVSASNFTLDHHEQGAHIGYTAGSYSSSKCLAGIDSGPGQAAVGQTTNAVLSNNTWVFIIITYSGSRTGAGVNIYVSSTTAQSMSVLEDGNASDNSAATKFSLMGRDSAGFTGAGATIAEVAVWPEVLDGGEITTLDAYACTRYAIGC
jgi:hypothetical protein